MSQFLRVNSFFLKLALNSKTIPVRCPACWGTTGTRDLSRTAVPKDRAGRQWQPIRLKFFCRADDAASHALVTSQMMEQS